jgi:hypothetical protein
MKRFIRRAATRTLVVMVALVLFAGPVAAHEHRDVNGHTFVVGWDVEPPFTGVANAAGVEVTRGTTPVDGAQLKAEILFGDKTSTQRTAPIDMEAAFGEPGKYSAPILPTRPGVYTFHITGTVDGQPVDQNFTSSKDTFESVEDPQEFPVKDPTRGELAQKIERLDPRMANEAKAAAASQSSADRARTTAFAALALAVVGLVLALSARRRTAGAKG